MKKEIEAFGEKEDFCFLPDEAVESICIIRCSNDKVINLPKMLLDEIGWIINQKVIWSIAELSQEGTVWKVSVEIETIDDFIKDNYEFNTKEKQ